MRSCLLPLATSSSFLTTPSLLERADLCCIGFVLSKGFLSAASTCRPIKQVKSTQQRARSLYNESYGQQISTRSRKQTILPFKTNINEA
jgi:hypothetical protein